MDFSVDNQWRNAGGKNSSKMKRKRAPAFTSVERELLLQLVDKYKNILESKKSDITTISKKRLTWERVSHEFAAQPNTSFKPAYKLKKYWENVKHSAKDEVKRYKKERCKTEDQAISAAVTPDATTETERTFCAMIPAQPSNNHQGGFPDSDGSCNSMPVCVLYEMASDLISKSPSTHETDDCDEKHHVQHEIVYESDRANAKHVFDKQMERTRLLELESKEHLLRMKVLEKQMEVEEINRRMALRRLQMMEAKHAKEMDLLEAKLANVNRVSVP